MTKSATILLLGLLTALPLAAQTRTPVIDHAPVKVAIRGQNILFRAKVTPAAKPIESVTLHYAVSRDAAPYRIPMTSAGAGIFTGTVSADLTASLPQLLYYVEARDTVGTTAETPWYTVEIKTGAPAAATATTVTAPAAQSAQQSSWKKPALIAGGALAVGGAALAIMGGGGGGGGDGGGGDDGGSGGTATNTAGTYSGTASVFFQPPSGSPSGSTYPITITVGSNGVVSSDSLFNGSRIEGQLSGVNFLLTAPVNEQNRTGEIQFTGVVINNRITGTVQGSATTPDGTGTYSGGFSAAK